MKIVYSDRHRLRDAKTELDGGRLIPAHECPRRADVVLAACRERRLGDVVAPDDFARRALLAAHDEAYLRFLESGWDEWRAAGHTGEMIASCWPSRAMPRLIPPRNIDGRAGFYALAGETSITEGTWQAAVAAANTALTGARLLCGGAGAVFALCRPPGHHAAADMFGGYCFLNNAALAAQWCRDNGAARAAVLDVDFHHGNGTQAIFYRRDDVLFLSLHGDPLDAFPYYLGHADESGDGAGAGFTQNYPLPPGADFALWREALAHALARLRQYAPDVLIVSLGVDTYYDDPLSFFKLRSDDFLHMGADIAGLGLPTAFVMEGGYATDALGLNMTNVLVGFEDGASN